MSDTESWAYYYGIADWWQAWADLIRGAGDGVWKFDYIESSLEVYEGYWALRLTQGDGLDTYVQWNVCFALPEGTYMSVRAMMTAGLGNVWVNARYSQVFVNVSSWEDWSDCFFANLVSVAEQIFYAMTDAITVPMSNSIKVFLIGDGGRQAIWVFTIPTPTEFVIWEAGMAGMEYVGAGDQSQYLEGKPYTPTPATQVVSNALDVSEIVQQLSDIANRTTVAQINNNGAIADLSSGDIVTPGDVPE